jgi:hypothetical protein
MVDLELPAGRRVPGGRHVHPLQEERFAVIEGTMHFRLGRKRVTAGPGEVVVVPPGVKHDFANAGDADALVRVEIRPALGMERLFETAVDLAERGRTMLGGIPKPLDLALFVREFEREVQAAFPPRWVQRVALAPLAWVARHRRRDGSIPKLVLTSLEPKTQWANSTWPDASAGSRRASLVRGRCAHEQSEALFGVLGPESVAAGEHREAVQRTPEDFPERVHVARRGERRKRLSQLGEPLVERGGRVELCEGDLGEGEHRVVESRPRLRELEVGAGEG